MKFRYALYILFFLGQLGCKKFITIDPPDNQLVSSTVFSDDATAVAAISGLYSKMLTAPGFTSGRAGSIHHMLGLSADEYKDYGAIADFSQFYVNNIAAKNSQLLNNLWGTPYNLIYAANSIVSGVTASTVLTPAVRDQVKGEALFIRSFCYFNLVNMYGDIPLLTTTAYDGNSKAARSTTADVYAQIINDLKTAETLLAEEYAGGNERVRANRSAAKALLARVYLFHKDYADAETEASAVINNSGLYSLNADLNTVFLKNSSEAILQLKPRQTTINTGEGSFFILSGVPSYVSLSQAVMDAFEAGDLRKDSWTHDTTIAGNLYHYPFKYKVKASTVLTEYSMVLRLAEQYLVRAEARAMQDNIQGARDDLNTIRNRAGLPVTTAGNSDELINAILHERQVELFTEWGNRWLDLKRLGRADAVMSVATQGKGGIWNSTAVLYPIPQSELDKNPSLLQNPGY